MYLNGQEIGSWKYGYSTFDMDITKYLVSGKNELLVRVIHQSPNSRWYSGAGIYRDVWLCTYPKSHFVMDGVYVTTNKLSEEFWEILVEAEISGDVNKYEYSIIDPRGNVIECSGINDSNNEIGIADDGKKTLYQQMVIHNPLLWDIGQGNIYKVMLRLWDVEGVVDEISENFGFSRRDGLSGGF